MSTHHLFSYGTLLQTQVQQAIFGRVITTRPATVVDHRIGEVRITDPQVIATSGTDIHPILEPAAGEHVDGGVLELTETELLAADAYEVDDYQRVQVSLATAETAWAYIMAPTE